MTMRTPLTEALQDDFLDDAVTGRRLIAHLIDEALAATAAGDDPSDDPDWLLRWPPNA